MKKKLFLLFTPLLLLATPEVPSHLQLQALSISSILIQWQDNSDNEVGFKIFRDGEHIYTTNTNAQQFIDTNLSPDTNYTYTVLATDDGIINRSRALYLHSDYVIPEDALFLDIRNGWERDVFGGYPEGSTIATYELREEHAIDEPEDTSKRALNENFINEVLNLTGQDKNRHMNPLSNLVSPPIFKYPSFKKIKSTLLSNLSLKYPLI